MSIPDEIGHDASSIKESASRLSEGSKILSENDSCDPF